MKTRHIILLIALAASPIIAVSEAAAHSEFAVGISINEARDFYQPLSGYGYWVNLPRYGRCWYPAYVGNDWRPYSDGHWEWTDSGWYWISDEPWAWACYHYGRWVNDPYYGWVWVPGTEWGPSWVSWREGGGYVGWAPLPPECDFGPNGVFIINIVIAPRCFVFVEQRRFCDRVRPSTVIVNQTIINQTIINKTRHITNIRRENNRVFVNGPDRDAIERVSSEKVRTGSAADLWRKRSERVMQRATVERVSTPPVTAEIRSTLQNAPRETPTREVTQQRSRDVREFKAVPRPAVIQQPAPVTSPAPSPVAERPRPRQQQIQQVRPEQPAAKVTQPPVSNRGNLFEGRITDRYRQPPAPKVNEGDKQSPRATAPGLNRQPADNARPAERHDTQGDDRKGKGHGRGSKD
jgi:hypothetical protein